MNSPMTPERWRQINQLFDVVVALDAGAREMYLAESCRDDPALRQEIEDLIAGHDESGPFRVLHNPRLTISDC